MSVNKSPLSLVGVGSGYLGPALYKSDDISNLARRVLDMYDKDKTGNLGHTEVANILIDMYRSINKNFSPSKFDIESYSKIMDQNRDGRVTQADIEACIRKYLRADVDVTKTTTTVTTTQIGSSRKF